MPWTLLIVSLVFPFLPPFGWGLAYSIAYVMGGIWPVRWAEWSEVPLWIAVVVAIFAASFGVSYGLDLPDMVHHPENYGSTCQGYGGFTVDPCTPE